MIGSMSTQRPPDWEPIARSWDGRRLRGTAACTSRSTPSRRTATVDACWRPRRSCCIGSLPVAGDVGIAYLDRARADEFFVNLKARSIESLSIAAGDRVADVGCGTGEDVAAMCAGASGVFGVGLDLSSRNVVEARRRHKREGIAFVVADGHALPIADGSLDGCRVERTLQHVAAPALVVTEIARALRPGGRVVVCEPDWSSCALAGADETVSGAVLAHWINGRTANPSIGRNLPRLLDRGRLDEAGLRSEAVIYRSLDEAVMAVPFSRAATEAAASGLVSQQEADAWIEHLESASEHREFVFTVPLFTAVGIKPGDPTTGGQRDKR